MLKPTQASNTNASEPLPDEANEANEHDTVNVNVNVNDNDIDIDGDRRASYGALRNVRLTSDQYRKITSTYRNAGELIDKVSRWLPRAKRPQQDHYKLVHRFAKNDDWPKKPQRKSAPKYVDPPMEEPDVITWDAPDPLPERKAGETARDWIARGKQEKNIARVPEQYREKVRRFYENGEVVLPDRVKGQKLPVWILAAFGVEQPEKIDLLHDEAWKPVIDDWLMSETGKVEFTSGEISRLCSWYNSTGFRQDLPPLEDGQPIFKWIHNCRNSA